MGCLTRWWITLCPLIIVVDVLDVLASQANRVDQGLRLKEGEILQGGAIVTSSDSQES